MHTMTKQRVAIYARVSTDDKGQDPENQLAQLREWCMRSGNEIVAEYVEHESGRKGTKSRHAFRQLFEDANQRKFDLVLFWSLDRFSREGMRQTAAHLQRLDAAGVAFHSYTEEMLSTDNELVRDILIAVMASLAKQEVIKISERTRAGLERAKAKGKQLGRPSVTPAQIALMRRLKKENPRTSVREIARQAKVSPHTPCRSLVLVQIGPVAETV